MANKKFWLGLAVRGLVLVIVNFEVYNDSTTEKNNNQFYRGFV